MVSKKVRFTVYGFVLSIFLVLMSLPAMAHAPRQVDLAYDFPSQTLTVTIEHWAVSPTVHFVEKVEVFKNEKKVESREYQSQPDSEKFTYTYKIEAKEGDVFNVVAKCSVFGTKTATLRLIKLEAVPVITAPPEEKAAPPGKGR